MIISRFIYLYSYIYIHKLYRYSYIISLLANKKLKNKLFNYVILIKQFINYQ